MKIIIYITALICSLLASPALATETGQISMTNMGLKVTSSPESTLYEGDTWMITARNNFSLNEAEIKNFVPSRISEELRPYVRLSKVEFTSNSDDLFCRDGFHLEGLSIKLSGCFGRPPGSITSPILHIGHL